MYAAACTLQCVVCHYRTLILAVAHILRARSGHSWPPVLYRIPICLLILILQLQLASSIIQARLVPVCISIYNKTVAAELWTSSSKTSSSTAITYIAASNKYLFFRKKSNLFASRGAGRSTLPGEGSFCVKYELKLMLFFLVNLIDEPLNSNMRQCVGAPELN